MPKTKKKHSGQFKKGNNFGKGRPKLDNDIKAIRDARKVDCIEACNKAFFVPSIDVEKIINDKSETPINRGFAKMALNFCKNGSTQIAELVCGINNLSTRAKEVDPTSEEGATYIDFLNDVVKKINEKK